jgi:hypothetical protein
MKNFIKALCCIAIIGSMFTSTFAQIGYTITDNDQDVTSRPQQLYRVNVANGDTRYVGDLVVDRNDDASINDSTAVGIGERIQREYEGLASIRSTVYAVPEFAPLDGIVERCGTGSDPIDGLSVDLRPFRVEGPKQTLPSVANRLPAPVKFANPSGVGQAGFGNQGYISSVAGPSIGETCINFGSESALGYNINDGYFYSVASDDLILLPNTRSRMYKINAQTGLAVAGCDVVNPNQLGPAANNGQPTGDFQPYLDGLTITPNGRVYGTELRFDNDPNAADADNRDNGGLYQIDISSLAAFNLSNVQNPQGVGLNPPLGACNAVLVSYLLPADINRDTGLANANNSNTNLFMLNEFGLIYAMTLNVAGPASVLTAINNVAPVTMGTNGILATTDGATGGLATKRIEGCRGKTAPGAGNPPSVNEFNAAPTVGICSDFEGFDIPQPIN